MLYYFRAFGEYPPSDMRAAEGSGYSGAQANPEGTRHNAAKQSSEETWKISKVDDTVAEVSAHACAPLFVFHVRLSQGLRRDRREAVSFFCDCMTAERY